MGQTSAMPPLLSRQPSAHELSDLPHLSDHDARTSLRIQREPYPGDDHGEPALAWPSTTTHAATALRRLFRWPWRGRSGSDKSSSCDINGYYYSAIDAQDSDHLRQEGSTLTTNFAQDAHLPASDQTTRCLSDALAQIHVCAVEGASLVDADVAMTERALCRCFALAAAVTTWCLLQPLIVFYVIAHFKQYAQSFLLVPSATFPLISSLATISVTLRQQSPFLCSSFPLSPASSLVQGLRPR